MSRGIKDIITDLTLYNPATATTGNRLSHSCYMIRVGQVRDPAYLTLLNDMVESLEESTANLNEVAASIKIMECEEVEIILEHIALQCNAQDLKEVRSGHFVYEDHFNPSLISHLGSHPTYEKLKAVCHKYETGSKNFADGVIAEHASLSDRTYTYFTERGLPEDEARAAAFAIAFYTGSSSETCSRGASLVARRANGVLIGQKNVDELNEASIILYYLVKGLSHIPYHWGYVTRACQLKDDELTSYAPGALVTWLQFSSSTRGKQVAQGDFGNRNTFFKIYSLTGRRIRPFSNFDFEDEVLFLPHSTFLVFKHVTTRQDTHHTVYMRQLELGLSTWSVLWVDDKIYDENWENKVHMEFAATKALNFNVHFIPKSSTDTALSFLRSPFGKRLKNKTSFRIVTDMTRDNEELAHNAGARLIKQLRELGFQNECLVFTSDKRKADQILNFELTVAQLHNVTVSIATDDLRRFSHFSIIILD